MVLLFAVLMVCISFSHFIEKDIFKEVFYYIKENDKYAVVSIEDNDIEIFKFCKNAVAMGNAISELKTITKFVTETNDNDGVAKFLIEKEIIT